MELPLFDHVGELTRTLVPAGLGELRCKAHRRGVKVWFDTEQATRNHWEAQLIPRRFVDGTDGRVIEVGFHAEHRNPDTNETTLTRLVAAERIWRRELGDEAEAGPFLGQPDWRRISEVWLDFDEDDPELAFELAARLADYVTHLAPHVPDE